MQGAFGLLDEHRGGEPNASWALRGVPTAAAAAAATDAVIERVPIDMRDVDKLVGWARVDEYFQRELSKITTALFEPDGYHIFVGDIDVTQRFPFFESPAFTKAFLVFEKEALFYAHLFPVVVLRVQRDFTNWLLALGQAPPDSRVSLQLPVSVQPLFSWEGQLVYCRNRQTGERYYQWQPASDGGGDGGGGKRDQWLYYVYTHTTDVATIEPLTCRADGARLSPALLDSPFRCAYEDRRRIAQHVHNTDNAEFETSHPHIFTLTKPHRDVMPESLSVADILGSDSLSDSSAEVRWAQIRKVNQFLVQHLAQYSDEIEALRREKDPADTRQAAFRRQFHVTDMKDQLIPLPENVGSVQVQPATHTVDVAEEYERYARNMTLRFGGLPDDDYNVAVRERRDVNMQMAGVIKAQREKVLSRKHEMASHLWSVAYDVGFARRDLASLATLLYELDEVQYQAKARDYMDAVRRSRLDEATNPGRRPRRPNTKAARELLATAAAIDTATVIPTLAELRAELRERLETEQVPTSTIEFDGDWELGIQSEHLTESEHLPDAVQEMRFKKVELLYRSVEAGIVAPEAFAKVVRELMGLDVGKALKRPAVDDGGGGGPAPKRARKE
jgi:hypothetical protein